jgi:hypothetical protein
MTDTTPHQRVLFEVRKQGLDKFYTDPSYAKHCIDRVGDYHVWSSCSLVIEPSAGNGSFSTQILHVLQSVTPLIAMDIEPGSDTILTQDFLEWIIPPEYHHHPGSNILTIGNPPFGRVSSLAIKFFNRAAQWSSMIAFIVPRTFRRISVQNKLDKRFHLIHDEDVPKKPCVFIPKMSAKCCFQIWKITDTELRKSITLPTIHADWKFMSYGPLDHKKQPTPPIGAHFALRAYGGQCGYIEENEDVMLELRPKSWHWIQSLIDPQILKHRFRQLDYSKSTNTARQNSIGRGELVHLYHSFFCLNVNVNVR